MTTRYSQWDVARAAKTMGIKAAISLHPDQITVRIKNKLIRWLNEGHLAGGYQSEARKIGSMLMKKFDLPASYASWRGIIMANPNPDTAHKVAELVNADWTAWIMDNAGYNQGYYRTQHEQALKWLRGKRDGERHLQFFDDKFKAEAIKVISSGLTDEDRAKIQKTIDAIQGSEPIHLFEY